jgi:ubiquinone biosynthesis monooxygenase Coq7
MSMRKLSNIDAAIVQFDRALQTLLPGSARAKRASPAQAVNSNELSAAQRRHSAGLMRINHTGEVCAQALYQGQAATAKQTSISTAMTRAATEEIDHLAWCEQRLQALSARTSLLNPLFYGMSFALGAGAGLLGDKVSLGFVAATEDQVCQHLESHLKELPTEDIASRAVLSQMLIDEAQHATVAVEAGAMRFPGWLKRVMTLASRTMTRSTYYI